MTRFTGKYGPIQVYAPYSYDAAMTLIAAMQKANSTDPAKYLPELAKISYDGVTAKRSSSTSTAIPRTARSPCIRSRTGS